MREIRLSGSEGGGAELNRPSLPYLFFMRHWVRRGRMRECSENRVLRAATVRGGLASYPLAHARASERLRLRMPAAGAHHFGP